MKKSLFALFAFLTSLLLVFTAIDTLRGQTPYGPWDFSGNNFWLTRGAEANFQRMSRWGNIAWANASTVAQKTGALGTQFASPVCTNAANANATTTTPSMRSCTSGTTANTFQNEGFDDNNDVVTGTPSNNVNLWLYTSGEMSSTSATRLWAAFLTDQTSTTMSTSDTLSSGNLVGIRYSSVAGDTDYTLVLCKAGTCASTPIGVAADTNFHHFLIEMNDANQTVTACLDPVSFNAPTQGTCVRVTTDYPGSFTPSTTGAGILLDNTTTTSETLEWGPMWLGSQI